MESNKSVSKYLKNMDIQNMDLLDDHYSMINKKKNNYSNFSLSDIGKSFSDAGNNVKNTVKDINKNISNTTKDAVKSTKDQIKDAGKNIKQTTKEIVHNDNLKKGLKANFLTYNPAVAIPRSSALLGFRVNLFGISSRLFPAFLSNEEIIKYKFDAENAENAKKAWEKIANFWEDKIGGDRKKLQEAITGAWNKPVFQTKRSKSQKRKTSGFDGDYDYPNQEYYSNYVEEAATGAYISAGLAIVGGLVQILADNKAKKNPYKDGSNESNDFNNELNEGGSPPPLNQDDLNRIIAAAQSDKSKGSGLDSTGLDYSDLNSSDNKVFGVIPKTAFWIGVSVIGLGIAALITYKIVKNKK